tara:strand:- start:1704 stop:1922 length:219 start_codon:yes stop_codon:yes gene_type:complete
MQINKHCLTSRQIKRRGHDMVKFYVDGWRYGYITKYGRKWATGKNSGDGSSLRLLIADESAANPRRTGWAKI